MAMKILKVVAWVAGIFWLTLFFIAIAYKDDPVIRGCVRSIAVSIASVFSDVKELKNETKKEIKKELQKEK